MVVHRGGGALRRETELGCFPLQIRIKILAALILRATWLLHLPVQLLDFELIDDAVLSLVHHLRLDLFLDPLGPKGIKP